MSLFNGLHMNNDLDKHLCYCVEEIKRLTGEVAQKNREIHSSEETLKDLRADGLVTPELEQTFSDAIQKSLDEKADLEKNRETYIEVARRELDDAKEDYDKAIDKIKISAGSQGAEVLLAIRKRVTEIEEWEKELQDAIDDND